MTERFYQVEINETAKNNPASKKSQLFNIVREKFNSLHDAEQFLINRYGKLPTDKWQKILICGDTQVGYIRTYWNKDYSHNSKSWYQTDWITIDLVVSEVITYLF